MAKEKKEEPVVDNETGSLKVKEKVKKQTAKNKTENNVTKVNLEKPVSPTVPFIEAESSEECAYAVSQFETLPEVRFNE